IAQLKMEPETIIDSRTRRRRWFGGLCLLGAIIMLALGQFVLPGRLGASGFLIYWLICFVLTVMAAFTALVDLKAVGLLARNEQRELLKETLHDIEEEQRTHGQDHQKDRK